MSQYFEKGQSLFDKNHSSPQAVIEHSVSWFEKYGVNDVLDLGAGSGKFCLAAIELSTIHFAGVEDSPVLWELIAKNSLSFPTNKVRWIKGSLFNVDFKSFMGFYFFNSFYEQKVNHGTQIRGKKFASSNYDVFNEKLLAKLVDLEDEVFVITYQGYPNGIAKYFEKKETAFNDELILWKRG